jgi:flagellar hook-length control protein FliK
MTIHHVGSSPVALARQQRHHAVGEHLDLKVLRRMDERRYLVSFQDAQHVVSSTVQLNVGSTVRAVVTALGEKLELRYVGSSEVTVAMDDHAAVSEDALAQLAMRYSVALQPAQRAAIERAAEDAQQPDTMIEGGMFLSKLALPVDDTSLQAVYSAQRWGTGGNAAATPTESPPPNAAALTKLAEQMLAALQPHSDGDRDSDAERDLAQRLLNEQDEGSVAYSFGVLPILIDDQLLELDLVHFRERRREDAPSGMRRLVMTFSTPTLGRVEVLAQALGDRLTIGMVTDSLTSREILAARGAEVRDLLARLGWNVEAVSYEYNADVSRAARRVLTHVLNSETLSRWV